MSTDKENLFWEFLNSITQNNENLFNDETASKYVPYSINHFLASSIDTVQQANQMNIMYHLDPQMQYDFLRKSIRKYRRRLKWLKKSDPENIELVTKYFGYSKEKARQALKLLSNEDLKHIKEALSEGGVIKKRKV